jgi:hypothetical protein
MMERWIRAAAGYQIEQWWHAGHAGGSSAAVIIQGVFLRCQLSY